MSQVRKISSDTSDLFFLNAYDSQGVIYWYYVKVNKLKLPIFKFKCEAKTANLNIEEYGKIVASGWGREPPPKLKAEIEGTQYEESDQASGDFVISLLNAYDNAGVPVYYYVAVEIDRLAEFEEKMQAAEFNVRENSIILLSGYGAPSDEEREMMEREYGFSHARLTDKDAPIPAYVND